MYWYNVRHLTQKRHNNLCTKLNKDTDILIYRKYGSNIAPAFPSALLYIPLGFPICRKVCHHIVYKQILYANSKLRTRKKNWNLKELHPRGLQRNGDAIVVYMWKKPREGSTPQTHLWLGHNPLRTPPLGKTSEKSNFLFRCRYFPF